MHLSHKNIEIHIHHLDSKGYSIKTFMGKISTFIFMRRIPELQA